MASKENHSEALKRPRGIESYFIALPKKKSTRSLQSESATDQKVQDEHSISKESFTTKTFEVGTVRLSPPDKPQAPSDEFQTLLKLEIETLDPTWFKALEAQLRSPYFVKLKKFLSSELAANKVIFPPAQDIYSWSRFTPVNQVKVVIIGQDPYHNFNQAHGLCFSVNRGAEKPPSLRNIFKELKNEYPEFIEPKHGYLGGWASQGVLLLNAALTVQAHMANSHADKGWEMFTDSVIAHLNATRKNLVFILWGSYAQKKGKAIDSSNHLVLKGVHPSPLSANRGFFGCNHFLKANEYLQTHGVQPINWLQTDTVVTTN